MTALGDDATVPEILIPLYRVWDQGGKGVKRHIAHVYIIDPQRKRWHHHHAPVLGTTAPGSHLPLRLHHPYFYIVLLVCCRLGIICII